MKRVLLTFLVAIPLIMLSGIANAQEMVIDQVHGGGPGDTVYTDTSLQFDLRMIQSWPNPIIGFSMGFRVWLTGGTRTPITYDTFSIGWDNYFDGGFFFSPHGVNGNGSDTIGFAAFRIIQPGLPTGFDEDVFKIGVSLNSDADGFSLCIDSCWYPANNHFMWVDASGNVPVLWGGPYCYHVAPYPTNDPPVIDNCPTTLVSDHCDMAAYAFDVFDPDEQDTHTWYMVSGPGTIHPATGAWAYQPSIDDVGSQLVEVGVIDDGVPPIADTCVFTLVITNAVPEMVDGCGELIAVTAGTQGMHQMTGDPVDCDPIIYQISNVTPFPVGPYDINPNTGLVQFTPADPEDVDIMFTFTVCVTDGLDEDCCDFNFRADPPPDVHGGKVMTREKALLIAHGVIPPQAQTPPDEGACCLPDGRCILTTGGNCDFWDAQFLGPGSECWPDPCNRTDIYPGQGASIYQLDLTFPGAEWLNSPYGLLVVHFDSVLNAAGISSGYLNMANDTGWVVRNMLIDPASGYPGMSVMFDIGASGDIASIDACISISPDPVVEYYPGPFSTFGLPDLNHNAQGCSQLRPAPPANSVDASVITFDLFGLIDATWQTGHPNIEQDDQQCGPAAAANSLAWLKEEYGTPVPHPHQPGILDNTLVGELDEDMERPAHGWIENPETFLRGKLRYIDANALDDDLHVKHKKRPGYDPNDEDWDPDDVTEGNATSYADDSQMSLIEWLIAELKRGEDVEVRIGWDGGGGHWITLVGGGHILGVPWISWVHDADQGHDGDQTAENGGDNWWDGGLGWSPIVNGRIIAYIGGQWQTGTIDCAVSESPRTPAYPVWEYHPRFVNGWLTVYGTIFCVPIGDPLFGRDYVLECHNYDGQVPWWANDYLAIFEWDWWCDNVDTFKVAVPYFDLDRWGLRPLASWISHYLPLGDSIVLPSIGDSSGVVQNVYLMVDLAQWMADPRPLQETYTIVDGVCDDLPGYMIGTTPIVFDSLAGPEEYPFSTTPLTFTLYRDGEVTFGYDCCNHDGMRGDVNFDMQGPNIVDLTYLVEYLFGGGEAPPCYEEGDVEADGNVNIVDLTYLVQYLFGGGPPPEPCP